MDNRNRQLLRTPYQHIGQITQTDMIATNISHRLNERLLAETKE